ncbi:MAG TPA: methyltransferase type 11 [Chitinophagaceae bacterium]|nr:methyltransferase type 11 [Chitinophagaceae bacterium]
MKQANLNVHYGCGVTAPDNWLNFDATPTLRIQKIPFIGKLLAQGLKNLTFPDNIAYGDIIKGLPVPDNSCKAVYCSHVLEHLSRNDCVTAIQNTYRLLQPGGIFRCVLPDLEKYVQTYLQHKQAGNKSAADIFMETSCLGYYDRAKDFKSRLIQAYGNSSHLWMWDEVSLKEVLLKVGFSSIRRCEMGDSIDPVFNTIEDPTRFVDHLAFECIK